MTVNSSANSVIMIVFAFSDNLSAENSKLSAVPEPMESTFLDVWGLFLDRTQPTIYATTDAGNISRNICSVLFSHTLNHLLDFPIV